MKKIEKVIKKYCLPSVEIKNYNVMIDGRILLDQKVKNNLRTCNNIQKITICQGDNYTTRCLLDYPYFENTIK